MQIYFREGKFIFRLLKPFGVKKATCKICGKISELISEELGVCGDCIREKPEKALYFTFEAHEKSRKRFGLPSEPPRAKEGKQCKVCVNQCRIPKDGRGYCGLVTNIDGNLTRLAGVPSKGLLDWYYDPLPTNCVGAWICAGCTGLGYPKFAYKKGAERGYANLAVFYQACSFDCLFCQNWHFREAIPKISSSSFVTAEELANKIHPRISCICYFGGDPSPQISHALLTSKLALEKAKNWNGIMRICWESNGTMSWPFAKKAGEQSLVSGGCVKFDLKAWSEPLNIALTGVTNKLTFENFERLAKFIKERPDPPFLIASTLLVPGYIDVEEITNIANLIADINSEIPYSLLGFFPDYFMSDLPTTSKKLAYECKEAAEKEGLVNVKIGNIHLLS